MWSREILLLEFRRSAAICVVQNYIGFEKLIDDKYIILLYIRIYVCNKKKNVIQKCGISFY